MASAINGAHFSLKRNIITAMGTAKHTMIAISTIRGFRGI